jgi:hypothetical protein
VVAVRGQRPQREREREKKSLQEDLESTAPGNEGKVIHGQAIRDEQPEGGSSVTCKPIARQRLNKQVPAKTGS